MAEVCAKITLLTVILQSNRAIFKKYSCFLYSRTELELGFSFSNIWGLFYFIFQKKSFQIYFPIQSLEKKGTSAERLFTFPIQSLEKKGTSAERLFSFPIFFA